MHKDKNAEFIYNTKMAVNSPKFKSALANLMSQGVLFFMESFTLISKTAHKALFGLLLLYYYDYCKRKKINRRKA